MKNSSFTIRANIIYKLFYAVTFSTSCCLFCKTSSENNEKQYVDSRIKHTNDDQQLQENNLNSSGYSNGKVDDASSKLNATANYENAELAQQSANNNDNDNVLITSKQKNNINKLVNLYFKSVKTIHATCYFADGGSSINKCSFELENNTEPNKIRAKIESDDKTFSMTLSNQVMIYNYINKSGDKCTAKNTSNVSIWTRMLSGQCEYDDPVIVRSKDQKLLQQTYGNNQSFIGAVVKQGRYKMLVLFSLYDNHNLKKMVGWLIYNGDKLITNCILENPIVETQVKNKEQ